MIRHPTAGRVRAFERGELTGRRGTRVAEHLAGCPRCRNVLQRSRAIRAAAAAVTSPSRPPVLDAILERIDGGEELILPVTGTSDRPAAGRRGSRRGKLRTAAAVLVALLVTAVGAMGALGPLGAWVRGVLDARMDVSSAGHPPVAGLDVPIPAEGLTVELAGADPALVVRVEVLPTSPEVDGGGLAVIEGLGEAAGARFRVGTGRVTVRGAGRGTFRLAVPVGVPRVRLIADGIPVLELREGRIFLRGGVPVDRLEESLGALKAGRGEP